MSTLPVLCREGRQYAWSGHWLDQLQNVSTGPNCRTQCTQQSYTLKLDCIRPVHSTLMFTESLNKPTLNSFIVKWFDCRGCFVFSKSCSWIQTNHCRWTNMWLNCVVSWYVLCVEYQYQEFYSTLAGLFLRDWSHDNKRQLSNIYAKSVSYRLLS